MSTSRTTTYQHPQYSREARLLQASSGDEEHAGRVEAELERVASVERGREMDRLARRRERADRRLERDLAGFDVLEEVDRDRGAGPWFAGALVLGLIGWVVIGAVAGAVYFGLRALFS